MAKDKILDFCMPEITLYPHVANICAMYCNNPYIMPAVMSELIGMVYDKEIDRIDFSISLEIQQFIKNYPLIYSHAISRHFVAHKWKQFSLFIKDMIDEEYYVNCLLDTYYISAYPETYGKEHYMHNGIIYGYDDKNREFLVGDSFENGKYSLRKITYIEMNNAFVDTYINDWLDGILLFKLKEDPFTGIGYNTDYIAEQCEVYLSGEMPISANYIENRRRKDLNDRFIYGINIYDELAKYMEDISFDSENVQNADIRLFYAIHDHLKVYEYLVKHLMQRNQIKCADELYRKFRQLRDRIKNLYMNIMKYNISGSKKIANSISSELGEIKGEEEKSIRLFIDCLKPDDIEIEIERQKIIEPDEIYGIGVIAQYSSENAWKRRKLSDDTIFCETKDGLIKAQFFGYALDIYVLKDEKFGQADVYIDDIKIQTIDYSNLESGNIIHISGFENGYHMFKIVNTSEDGKSINFTKAVVYKREKEENDSDAVRCQIGKREDIIGKGKVDGQDIICEGKELPSYLNQSCYTYVKAANVLLMHRTASKRGVPRYDNNKEHIAAYALSDKEFIVDMVIPGGYKKVAFYSVDYDNLDRSMIINAMSEEGRLYDSCEVKNYSMGVAIVYNVKGRVKFHFVNKGGPDVTLSAVYFVK